MKGIKIYKPEENYKKWRKTEGKNAKERKRKEGINWKQTT